ncbi:hypothetical protein NADFUDRAFT_80873 [Nadsonia fulvescens var. elongata DSM 6958]|uniref:Uncharacterized protein n=1 Tax=Nadsonia fulvescens var. elongata DSM 6958 TaxID=857566 RepID=A0A1E3PQH4_9ASCO|nr:hypothetical protein NADFUDRAFT_80873 [Nadsonia fulvescens var. elongata DSM 6958]
MRLSVIGVIIISVLAIVCSANEANCDTFPACISMNRTEYSVCHYRDRSEEEIRTMDITTDNDNDYFDCLCGLTEDVFWNDFYECAGCYFSADGIPIEKQPQQALEFRSYYCWHGCLRSTTCTGSTPLPPLSIFQNATAGSGNSISATLSGPLSSGSLVITDSSQPTEIGPKSTAFASENKLATNSSVFPETTSMTVGTSISFSQHANITTSTSDSVRLSTKTLLILGSFFVSMC